MLLRLCQLKSLILCLLLLTNCSGWKKEKGNESSIELVSMFSPAWFKVNAEHTLRGPLGKAQPHLFFDVTPEFSMDSRTVNAVVTTPEAADQNYRLDLASGQRYYAFSYCKKNRPLFSIGHIPRMLDQLGLPQKVIIFGSDKKIKETYIYNYFRVRLLGAYVEKSCSAANCTENKNWFSRLVFIAVDTEESRYEEVEDLEDFLQIEKWSKIKAVIESMDGKNAIGTAMYDYIKAGNPFSFEESFEFFKKHFIYMSDDEMKKVQNGCYALYDKLWSEVGVEQEVDRPVKTSEELKQKVKLREELRKKKFPVGFAERFQAFTLKYFDEITTCSKFVYSGNLNKDSQKFWFLSYVKLFFVLHKEGYYFDCKLKSWQRNAISNAGSSVYDIKRGILGCKEKDLDQAMSHLPSFLGVIRNDVYEHFRFVEYDTHVFGSHSKLYSWVKMPNKTFECGPMNEKIRESLGVFPEDVNWRSREVKDIETELKIIY